MKVKIQRQQSPVSEPYWETFDADVPGDMSIAGLIDHLNYRDDILDENGRKTTRIGWECSCLQGICGSCAMVINEVPALACETFVKDLKGDVITIRPLRKFPVIHDLLVDRSVIHENLKKMNIFIREYQPEDQGRASRKEREHSLQYTAAKCLKCGLCLEVCPNYTNGKNFFGAIFANDCYLVASRNRSKAENIREAYEEHFGRGCSKAFSCMDVCPMEIPTIASMARMNRK
ncbi:MAG: 2Fe-2S iron-sulfur cluster-binding protein [Lachnospiraceae bacterium]|nr:succinate dehydrogenase/fumarate reductase iron-sulfur subunit [Lachnospiraceae bacterium]MEE3377784.1 2Fe-2S iron-sulfur cluster-binding protein [Lachnospiraceae bacterium]